MITNASLLYVPREELLQHHDSLYKLVLLASKRALELSEGAPPLVETDKKQPANIALEEIRQGKVSYRLKDAPPEPKKKRAKHAGA